MSDVIWEAVSDSLRSLPFLLIAYLLIELSERRAEGKAGAWLKRAGVAAPVFGAVLGCVPQCGVSVAAAEMFAGGLISPGTLIAVFIATSDEALPVMLSQPNALFEICRLLGVKLVSAVVFGVLFDILFGRYFSRNAAETPTPESETALSCDKKSEKPEGWAALAAAMLKKTAQVFAFILGVNVALGLGIHLIGEEGLSRLLLAGSAWQIPAAAAVGFIPNCAASVALTELYLSGALSFGAAAAGLCSGAGLGLAALFRLARKNKSGARAAAVTAYIFAAAIITGVVVTVLL